MTKYIVKNCPSFVLMQNARQTYFDVCGNGKIGTLCKERTDCPLKQIIEKCKKVQNVYNSGNYETNLTDIIVGKYELTEDILKLFDIQEVD